MKDINKNFEYEPKEKDDIIANDPLDVLLESIKVHTTGVELNEDATLSNLDEQFSKYAKYVMEQLEIITILKGFFKCDIKVIKYGNKLDEWGEELIVDKPDELYFEQSKSILLNKVHSLMLLSRSVKGKPLKAFLTYGRDVSNKELGMEEKLGLMDRILGKKPQEKDNLGEI